MWVHLEIREPQETLEQLLAVFLRLFPVAMGAMVALAGLLGQQAMTDLVLSAQVVEQEATVAETEVAVFSLPSLVLPETLRLAAEAAAAPERQMMDKVPLTVERDLEEIPEVLRVEMEHLLDDVALSPKRKAVKTQIRNELEEEVVVVQQTLQITGILYNGMRVEAAVAAVVEIPGIPETLEIPELQQVRQLLTA